RSRGPKQARCALQDFRRWAGEPCDRGCALNLLLETGSPWRGYSAGLEYFSVTLVRWPWASPSAGSTWTRNGARHRILPDVSDRQARFGICGQLLGGGRSRGRYGWCRVFRRRKEEAVKLGLVGDNLVERLALLSGMLPPGIFECWFGIML